MARRIRIAVLLVVLAVLGAVLLRIQRSLHPRVPLEVEAKVAAEAATRATPGCSGMPLPTGARYVADGLCVGLVAAGHGRLRQITFAPDGDLYGVNRSGEILRFRDTSGDGFFELGGDEVTTWADTGGNGNNAHIDVAGGFLYAGTPDGVRRWPWSADAPRGGDGQDVVVGQPVSGGHGTHTAHVWDGVLYVQSGSYGNATNPMSPAYDTERLLIRRFALAELPAERPFRWEEGEVITVGLRNTNGFARRADGAIWGVMNGLDEVTYRGRDVHEDNPGEPVVRIAPGRRYGYPFCFTAQRVVGPTGLIPAGTQLRNEIFEGNPYDDAWCAAHSDPPGTFIQAHSAPLEIVFLDAPSAALPARWVGGAFVALHGSWNRDRTTGYKVIWIPFDPRTGEPPMPVSTADATRFPYEVVFGGGSAAGHVDGRWTWTHEALGTRTPRPAGLAISPVDGALYVSSDSDGDLYRIALAP